MSSTKPFVLIDDDEIFNFLHQAVIRQVAADASIQVFQSSKAALEAIHEKPFQNCIFLIDIRMPEINGFELLDAFQQLPADHFTNSQVYFVTSSLDDRDREKGLSYPLITGYLEKPISIDKIKEIAGL
jgi:CheY-like chemotaxis protein